jgi:hypothetical protein
MKTVSAKFVLGLTPATLNAPLAVRLAGVTSMQDVWR